MTRLRGPAMALALVAHLLPLAARAQAPGLPPPGGGQMGEEEPKSEGVAEKAPKEPGQLPTVPVLPPWPGQKKKQFQLFELDGYYRIRTDWFKKFHMGFHDRGAGTPFREPLSCQTGTPLEIDSCSDTVSSANMRLRLEPIVNLSEQVSVHAQIDVLDNLVLGSTPDGITFTGTGNPADVPLTGFSQGQVPPEGGKNNGYDSIRVKRAWAEVMTPMGLLKFGRMPTHWGMGILENSGGWDPFHGTQCLDCDYGDTVDRVYFTGKIPGTDLRGAIARDWAAGGYTASNTDIWGTRSLGQPWDLDNADDMKQTVFILSRLDEPEVWKERIEAGEWAFNYGIYAIRRTYDHDIKTQTNEMMPDAAPQTTIVHREANFWIPDVYFRLGHGKMNLELEGVLHYGTIESLGDISPPLADKEVTVLGLGGVGRLSYLMADDDLELGFELGFASGDQWEGSRPGLTNVHDKPFLPVEGENIGPTGDQDTTISNFFFDYDYHVDLILFREIIGTVTNAWYTKPYLSYDLTDRLTFKAQTVVSFAHVPVSTPGNGLMYGIELDGDLGYHNDDDGFFAGLSYGVLFPLSALDHRKAEHGFTSDELGEADTAQTIQMRLMVKF